MLTYEMAAEKSGRARSDRGYKLDRNTYVRQSGADYEVILHDTPVVTIHPDNSVTLESGGWRTVTTKDRMNQYLPESWHLDQDGGVWYLQFGRYWDDGDNASPRYVYRDGVTVWPGGKIRGHDKKPDKQLALQKKVSAYAKSYAMALAQGKVPRPSMGDCFYCQFTVSEGPDQGRGVGEAFGNPNHLLSHIQEKYYVPSLLSRAHKLFPNHLSLYAEDTIARLWADPEDHIDPPSDWGRTLLATQATKLLKKYLRQQLRLVQ